MRFYLITIQYNKESKAENRTVPKAYDDLAKAEADFYEQVGKDMKNAVLGGSLNMVTNSAGGVHMTKQWGVMEAEVESEATE